MISENDARRGRGRPSKFPDVDLELIVRGFGSKAKTRRQHLNVFYMSIAIRALAKETTDGRMVVHSKFRWLHDESRREQTSRWYKATILSELGRIGNRKEIRKIAAGICEKQFKTKNAVAMIRTIRKRRKSETPDVQQLTKEIDATIRHFRARYPETTSEIIIEALTRNVERELDRKK